MYIHKIYWNLDKKADLTALSEDEIGEWRILECRPLVTCMHVRMNANAVEPALTATSLQSPPYNSPNE